MPEKNPSPAPAPNSPPLPGAADPKPAEPVPDPSKLTPEEQMALYEKDLKENDWGHQPC